MDKQLKQLSVYKAGLHKGPKMRLNHLNRLQVAAVNECFPEIIGFTLIYMKAFIS